MSRLRAVTLVTLMMLGAGRAFAQAQEPSAPHVRTDSADIRTLIDEGVRRSPTIRTLVDRLDHSDVVVYVRTRDLPRLQLDGRLGFLVKGGGCRYVVVELSRARTRDVQLATLGHELRHAVEIADAPDVTNVRSLAAHYAHTHTPPGIGREVAFETEAALATGRQVHHDLITLEMKRAGADGR